MTSRVCRFLAQWCWDLLLTRKKSISDHRKKIDKNQNQRTNKFQKKLLKEIAESPDRKPFVICRQSFDNWQFFFLTKRISFSFIRIEFCTNFFLKNRKTKIVWFDLVVREQSTLDKNGSEKVWISLWKRRHVGFSFDSISWLNGMLPSI